jgi:glycosyltransferase involved in cell wall biosynthesis
MSKHNQYLKFEYNKNFDQVTVLTQADVDFIGDRLNNVTHLPNPLAFEPVDKIPSKKNTIIAVGRLDAGYCKGFDVLIRALGLCKKSDWKLQIIGSGSPSSTEKYKSLAKECGVIDQTEFLGFLDNPVQAYRDAAIFVLSSRYEGFGMVLIEAMSQGCACIACDYKGRQKEIINDDKYGLLCSPDDPEDLAKCINLMIEDEAYRKEVQENAPLRAKYYSLENIMNRWDDIFDKIGI